MVAPVSTLEHIAGKFIVVASIGMLSALLNILSIAGTIYLSGLGDTLVTGHRLNIPLYVLPWVFVVLLPLAVLFSAALLAVCSFARSFKEAQNYVMPVMMAALIPAIVGMLPGVRLEGPLLVMPVTNIVLLTRDLFLGVVNVPNIVLVFASTSIFALAAIAVAARLFGQEAVLFNDNSSVRTLFMRRFFKPADYPSAAAALVLLALSYSLNFFMQSSLHRTVGLSMQFFYGLGAILIILFAGAPLATASYLKIRIATAFSLDFPPLRGWLAAACFGTSTWILAAAWLAFQQNWLPVPAAEDFGDLKLDERISAVRSVEILFLFALIPAICEEFFFRGFVLSGLRRSFGAALAIMVVAAAFAIYHQLISRFAVTFVLGCLFGLMTVRFRSIWPAILAHLLHNALATASQLPDLLQPKLEQLGFGALGAYPPAAFTMGAALLTGVGLALCIQSAANCRRSTIADPRVGAITPTTVL